MVISVDFWESKNGYAMDSRTREKNSKEKNIWRRRAPGANWGYNVPIGITFLGPTPNKISIPEIKVFLYSTTDSVPSNVVFNPKGWTPCIQEGSIGTYNTQIGISTMGPGYTDRGAGIPTVGPGYRPWGRDTDRRTQSSPPLAPKWATVPFPLRLFCFAEKCP